MGSTSHLANELGNEDKDHRIIDGRILYCRSLYSMYKMDCVQQLDLGSSLVEVLNSKLTSGQWRVARSCDSLSIKSFSLFLHGSSFIKVDSSRVQGQQDDTG